MAERPGDRKQHGPVATAISTSTLGNSTAFGFSITITGGFGVIQTVIGSPTMVQVLLFAVAAAAVVAVLEGLLTRGFRVRVGTVPAEVAMLGTAQNFIPVALGIGSAPAARRSTPHHAAAARGSAERNERWRT
jgi:hypothetical protein